MATIRLSGTIPGANEPHRAWRARLRSLLFAKGRDIGNSKRDPRIALANLGRKLIEWPPLRRCI